MIEFNINGKDYTISDVTIGQFYKIQHLLIVEGADAKLQIISLLSGCPVNELKTLEQFQFMQLFASVAEGPLNTEADKKLYKHIGLNGKAYGLLDFSKISIGEFADMDVLKADPLKEQKLHLMMAIIYRPAMVISETTDWIEIEPYNAETVEARSTEFLDLPLKYVHSAISFFLLIPKYLLNAIMDSQETMKTETTMDPKMQEVLKSANQLIFELQEDGTMPSILSQETIFSTLTELQKLTQHSSSTI